MSHNNWSKNSMKNQLEVVPLKQSVNIEMSDEILNKIKFLCKSIAKVEWSGVLFYTIDGTVKKPEEMTVILQDILPMDKGTGGYTEYDVDERYVSYLMDNESRMEWHMGHIHSHNTMAVYFSGTDMEELNDNSGSHNLYLSLIVNNYMDFKAKIGFRGEISTEVAEIPYMAKDEEGEEYVIDTATFVITKEKMFTYDCTVNSRQENISVDEDFAKKVDVLVNPPKKEELKKKPPVKVLGFNKYRNKFKGSQKKKGLGWQNGNHISNPNFNEDHTPAEIFIMSLLSFSTTIEPTDTIDDMLNNLEDIGLNSVEIAEIIVMSYAEEFERHFPLFDETGTQFLAITEEVVGRLEEEQSMYPILDDVVDALNIMLIKFKEYDTDKRNV